MAPRVLVAGIFHETHSFLAEGTGRAAFESSLWVEGPEVVRRNRGSGSPMDGVLELAEARGWEVVPSIHLGASPAGTVAEEVVEAFDARFFADLAAEKDRLDGIFLVLHGAMVSERRDDVEGQLLARIRRELGSRGAALPVVGVLDLHANVSTDMVHNATYLTAYRENPHADARKSAVRAAEMLDGFLAAPGSAAEVRGVHHPTPYVLPPTGVGSASLPMRAVLARAREIEAEDPELLGINVMAGYSYADIPDCGFSLNAYTRGDPGRVRAHLAALQSVLEEHLAEGYPHEEPLAQVLERVDALPPGPGPVLLVEAADNIGGGAPGDATDILGPLLATGRSGIVAALADPEAARACHAAGLGATVTLDVGAKTDAHHGRPVTVTGVVKHLSDGRFELENKQSHLASMQGTRIDMGPSAVLDTGQALILLTSRKTAPMDLGHLHSQGVRPEDAAYVIVKAAVSHRAAYDPIARASFNVDSAGLCTSNLTRLPYTRLSGKIIAPGAPPLA